MKQLLSNLGFYLFICFYMAFAIFTVVTCAIGGFLVTLYINATGLWEKRTYGS